MNALTPSQARTYRRIHRTLWLSPITVIGLVLLASLVISERGKPWLLIVLVAFVLGAVLVLALIAFEMHVLRVVAPDGDLRRRVVGLSLLRPIGFIWAFDELVGAAERLTEAKKETDRPVVVDAQIE